ncbi:MAG: ABC transporter permease [Gammaproteobacteria bacterium]
MQHFSISPSEMLASFWRNRSLTAVLVKRDVIGRYRGSMLGILWSFFNPLLMLAVYTFVFGYVFKARWHSGGDSIAEFVLVLFVGLIVFNLFAECVNRAPGLILYNVNYVKKVVFPLEIFPWVAMGSALFHGLINLAVWFAFYFVVFGLPHASVLFLPLVILPILLMSIGISWFLASLGVYLRDISQIIGPVVTMLMFLSGIFYSVSSIPPEYQELFRLNPFVLIIEQTRNVLIWGKEPDYPLLLELLAGSTLLSWLGFAWFQKTRKGFADVI